MQEIIQQLVSKAGLSQEQATKALQVMSQFIKDKFPMAGTYVDSMFTGDGDKGGDNPLKKFMG